MCVCVRFAASSISRSEPPYCGQSAVAWCPLFCVITGRYTRLGELAWPDRINLWWRKGKRETTDTCANWYVFVQGFMATGRFIVLVYKPINKFEQIQCMHTCRFWGLNESASCCSSMMRKIATGKTSSTLSFLSVYSVQCHRQKGKTLPNLLNSRSNHYFFLRALFKILLMWQYWRESHLIICANTLEYILKWWDQLDNHKSSVVFTRRAKVCFSHTAVRLSVGLNGCASMAHDSFELNFAKEPVE